MTTEQTDEQAQVNEAFASLAAAAQPRMAALRAEHGIADPPSPHVTDLERQFTYALDAANVLNAELQRLRAHKTDLTRVHDLVGLGVSRATEARLRDADVSLDAIERALAALRGDR